ncbi:hypothetical protein U1701_13255 [Sphingomonas sp. PB2P19]|uniref:hypothetical protein n=1 Tax=Sphingomonas rhamnosi TaxID=3096156 RepID=UPI002FCA16E6
MTFNSEQARAIADRLGKLFHRAMQLQAEKPVAPLRAVHVSELLAQPMRSRLESVDDGATGINYAAWVIGETLAILGGNEAMHAVFSLFETANGARASSWLDHRWNGIEAPDALWVS